MLAVAVVGVGITVSSTGFLRQTVKTGCGDRLSPRVACVTTPS